MSAILSRTVTIRHTGGSSILTIPKEFAKLFGSTKNLIMTQQDNGEITLKPDNLNIDIVSALNALDSKTVQRMASDTGFNDIQPVGSELW